MMFFLFHHFKKCHFMKWQDVNIELLIMRFSLLLVININSNLKSRVSFFFGHSVESRLHVSI